MLVSRRITRIKSCNLLILFTATSLPIGALETARAEPARDEARLGLQRAVEYFRGQVATNGGYVWEVSSDLTHRKGEAVVGTSTIWVQPPGTPSIGAAYLDAYDATGEAPYLDAAREAAGALLAGQMRSGGWYYSIEFDPEKRAGFGFRDLEPRRKQQTKSTLDDDTTTAALRFLMQLDAVLEFQDAELHEAVTYGLRALVNAQAPNGGWYQWWDAFPEHRRSVEDFPVLAASYPEEWSRRWGNDWPGRYYTNDNVMANVIETLLRAHSTYADPAYLQAAEGAGAFLILAQMPEPQPAWAQQYDIDMHPCWDRKFEPPAVSGGESQGILDVLLTLYRATGNAAYLRPVPRAIDYLRRSQLADGRLARFYELETNRPLYFTKAYQLTHDDSDVPTHYSFVVANRLDRIETDYLRLLEGGRDAPRGPKVAPEITPELEDQVETILAALDERGAWVGPRDLIQSRTFVDNVAILCRFLKATSPEPTP